MNPVYILTKTNPKRQLEIVDVFASRPAAAHNAAEYAEMLTDDFGDLAFVFQVSSLKYEIRIATGEDADDSSVVLTVEVSEHDINESK